MEALTLTNYRILESIKEDAQFRIFSAERLADGKPVCLKTTVSSFPEDRLIALLKNEFAIARQVDSEVIPRYLERFEEGNRLFLAMEIFSGDLLPDFLEEHEPSLSDLLRISLGIAAILADLWKHHIIHRDLRPAHFLVEPESLKIHLVHYGMAGNRKKTAIADDLQTSLQQDLSYVSPEQTGRTGWQVDHRTDMYSLGIIFYEMFTGQLPFKGDDTLEILYQQVAGKATSPRRLNPKLPQALSDLIEKLLAKSPAERYQAVPGLEHDLRYMLDHLGEPETLAAFGIGRQDRPQHLEASVGIHGREDELNLLIRGFERLETERVQLALLHGPEGVGKTFLAQGFRNKLLGKSHLFSSGRFESRNRDFTSGGLIASVRKLLARFLSLGQAEFTLKKETIRAVLGHNAGLLIRVLPELKLFFPDSEAAAPLVGTREQNRFFYAFRLLLKSLGSPEIPLVLFLDDLQWADTTTFRLLSELAVEQDLHHLYLIGSYREEDCGPEHPIRELIKSLAPEGILMKLEVAPLALHAILNWTDELLGPNPENSKLAALLHQRTHGIPFFLDQFFLRLVEENMLTYDADRSCWIYELAQIKGMELPANAEEIIKSKIELLPEGTIKLLSLASVQGFRFRESDLRELLELDEEEATEMLEQAAEAGIVVQEESGWLGQHRNELRHFSHRFLQPSLQDHFYSRLEPEFRSQWHAVLGRKLKAEGAEAEQDIFFSMLTHLNLGQAHLNGSREILELIQFNHKGGERALRANSYEQALFYLENGRKLMKAQSARTEFTSLTALSFLIGQTHYLLGNFEEAETTFRDLLETVVEITFRLEVTRWLCRLLISQGRQEDSLNAGLAALAQSRYAKSVPRNKFALQLRLVAKMLKLRFALKPAKLKNPDPGRFSDEPELYGFLRIYEEVMVSALSLNPAMFGLLVAQQIEVSLQEGFTPFTPSALGSYAIMIAVGAGDYPLAIEMGEAALKLSEQEEYSAKAHEIRFGWSHFLLHLNNDVRGELDFHLENRRLFQENGNPNFAGYCLNSRVWSMVCLGVNLEEVGREIEGYIREFRLKGEDELLNMMMPRHVFIRALTGEIPQPWKLSSPEFDAEATFQMLKERGSNSVLGGLVLSRIQISWLFRKFEEGVQWMEKGNPYLASMEGIYFTCEYYLYALLNTLGLKLEKGLGPDGQTLRNLKAFRRKLDGLYHQHPGNYGSHYSLFEAAFAHLHEHSHAGKLYEEAIQTAKSNKFLQNYAIANELTAELAGEVPEERNAFLKNALQGYRIWGARAKVAELNARFPDVFGQSAASLPGQVDNLDLRSILKASGAISEEIRLQPMLERLLKILMENAGATQGCFVRPHEGALWVEVAGKMNVEGFQSEFLQAPPDPARFPLGVLRYVARTREKVTLNAGFAELFPDDPYLETYRPKSLLCHPILSQGEFLGLIYLENRLVRNSFSSDRLELFSLLSGQIAISVQNAILYQNLEEKVAERTEMLEAEQKKAEHLLLNILPEHTAQELKETGKTRARKYDEVTILFTDIVGFTPLAEQRSPEQLVHLLDTYFGECDRIAEKYNLEKIKTIGDAYLCVGGLHEQRLDSAHKTVFAGLEMTRLTERLSKEFGEFNIRVGIHTGPVVAGVVGTKKFAYDIWGDAVNIAARMESASHPGRVNLSESTWKLVQDTFHCEFRGKIKAKNKGELPMYFVVGVGV